MLSATVCYCCCYIDLTRLAKRFGKNKLRNSITVLHERYFGHKTALYLNRKIAVQEKAKFALNL